MAQKSSFFTSLNGDRRYKATDFADYFRTFIGNGVFPNPSTNLTVTTNGDMTVNLSSGPAWINGYMYDNTDDLTLTLSAADGVLARIDRVVIRCDFVNREIKAYIRPGTFSQNPVAPELVRNNDYYELCVAEIKVPGGAASIAQSDITDTRLNSSLCGIVTQTVKEIDTTVLYNKLEAYIDERGKDISGWIDVATSRWEIEFNTWFDTIKGILDADVAGNLANRILELEKKVGSGLVAEGVSIKDTGNHFESTQVEGALNELAVGQNSLKLSVVNGKKAIAGAITDRGITTPADATFDTMKNNILSIKGFPPGWDREATGKAMSVIFQGDPIVFSKGATGTIEDMNTDLFNGPSGMADQNSRGGLTISCMKYGGVDRKFLMVGMGTASGYLNLYEYKNGQYIKFPNLGSWTNLGTPSDMKIDRVGNRLIVATQAYVMGFTIGDGIISSLYATQISSTSFKRKVSCSPISNVFYVLRDIYTTGQGLFILSSHSLDTGALKKEVSLPAIDDYPSDMFIHPDGSRLTLTGTISSKSIVQVELTNLGSDLGTPLATPVEGTIRGLSMHPKTGNLYIGYQSGGILEVRDGKTLQVIHTQKLGNGILKDISIDQEGAYIAYICDGKLNRARINSDGSINLSSVISITPDIGFDYNHTYPSFVTLAGGGDVFRRTNIDAGDILPLGYNSSLDGTKLKPVFKLITDVYKSVSPAVTSTTGPSGVDISSDSKFLVYVRRSNGPFAFLIINEDGTFGVMPDGSSSIGGSGGYYECVLSRDNRYLFVGSNSSPYIWHYSVEPNAEGSDIPYSVTKLPNPSVSVGSTVYGIDYSFDDRIGVCSGGSSGHIHLYKHENGILTKYPSPISSSASVRNIRFCPKARVAYAAPANSGYTGVAVSYDDNTQSQAGGIGTVLQGLSVSPSGEFLATNINSTGHLAISRIDDTGLNLTNVNTFEGLGGTTIGSITWINDRLLLVANNYMGVVCLEYDESTKKFINRGKLTNISFIAGTTSPRGEVFTAANEDSFLLLPYAGDNTMKLFSKIPLRTVNEVKPLKVVKLVDTNETIGMAEESASIGQQIKVTLFDKLKV